MADLDRKALDDHITKEPSDYCDDCDGIDTCDEECQCDDCNTNRAEAHNDAMMDTYD